MKFQEFKLCFALKADLEDEATTNQFSELRKRKFNNENENLENFLFDSKIYQFLVKQFHLRPILKDF